MFLRQPVYSGLVKSILLFPSLCRRKKIVRESADTADHMYLFEIFRRRNSSFLQQNHCHHKSMFRQLHYYLPSYKYLLTLRPAWRGCTAVFSSISQIHCKSHFSQSLYTCVVKFRYCTDAPENNTLHGYVIKTGPPESRPVMGDGSGGSLSSMFQPGDPPGQTYTRSNVSLAAYHVLIACSDITS